MSGSWEDQCRSKFGGSKIWDWWESGSYSVGGPGGSGTVNYSTVHCLWQGTFITPRMPCSYCGTQMDFVRYDAPRPVPKGATDLGLTDPAVAWRCPKCGQAGEAKWLVNPGYPGHAYEEYLKGLLCTQCSQPFRAGDAVMALLAFSSEPEGKVYHEACFPEESREPPHRPLLGCFSVVPVAGVVVLLAALVKPG